jgi:hypothetical protein
MAAEHLTSSSLQKRLPAESKHTPSGVFQEGGAETGRRRDANNLIRPQDFERLQHIRHENQQIIEIRGAGSNNHQRDRTTTHTLLIRHDPTHHD